MTLEVGKFRMACGRISSELTMKIEVLINNQCGQSASDSRFWVGPMQVNNILAS